MSEKEISFQKRGEEPEWQGYRRDWRYGPNHELLADYQILDGEGKYRGDIQEDPYRRPEYVGLWGISITFGSDHPGYCHPQLVESLEEAQIVARVLLALTHEELLSEFPEPALWAL